MTKQKVNTIILVVEEPEGMGNIVSTPLTIPIIAAKIKNHCL